MAESAERKCYIVSFDVSSDAIREKVKERLKEYESYCPINRHCWAIVTDAKAREIRNKVGEVIGPRNRLFVVRSGTEAAWRNSYGEKYNEWLKKNL